MSFIQNFLARRQLSDNLAAQRNRAQQEQAVVNEDADVAEAEEIARKRFNTSVSFGDDDGLPSNSDEPGGEEYGGL